MAQLNFKIKAFTIVESMVSMVIVMLVFSLTSMVIVNVIKSGVSRDKQNAYMFVNAIRNETIQQARFIDETVEVNDILIQKTILEYKKSENLKVLLIEAFKGETKLFESKEIVMVEQI